MAYERLQRDVAKLERWLQAAEEELRMATVKHEHEAKLAADEAALERELQKAVAAQSREAEDQENRLKLLQTAIEQCEASISLYEEDVSKLEVEVTSKDKEVQEELSIKERESSEQAASFEAIIDGFEEMDGFKEWLADRGNMEATAIELEEMEKEIEALAEELSLDEKKKVELTELCKSETIAGQKIQEEIKQMQAKIDAMAKEMNYVEGLLQEKETLCRQGKAETYESQSQSLPHKSSRESDSDDVEMMEKGEEHKVSDSDVNLQRMESFDEIEEKNDAEAMDQDDNSHKSESNHSEEIPKDNSDGEDERNAFRQNADMNKGEDRIFGPQSLEQPDARANVCRSPCDDFQQSRMVKSQEKKRQFKEITLQDEYDNHNHAAIQHNPRDEIEKHVKFHTPNSDGKRIDERRALNGCFEDNSDMRGEVNSPADGAPYLSRIPRTPKTPKRETFQQPFASIVRSAQQLLTPKVSRRPTPKTKSPFPMEERHTPLVRQVRSGQGEEGQSGSQKSVKESERGKIVQDDRNYHYQVPRQEHTAVSKRTKLNFNEQSKPQPSNSTMYADSESEESAELSMIFNKKVTPSKNNVNTKFVERSAKKTPLHGPKKSDKETLTANQVRHEAQAVNRTPRNKSSNIKTKSSEKKTVMVQHKGDAFEEHCHQDEHRKADTANFDDEHQAWENTPGPFMQMAQGGQPWMSEQHTRSEQMYFDFGPSEQRAPQDGGPITQYFKMFGDEQEANQEEYGSSGREEPFNINLGQSHTTQAFGFHGFNF